MLGRLQVASQFIEPTMLCYTFVRRLRSWSSGDDAGMESIGIPERYGVMLGKGFVASMPNQWAENLVNTV